jgi:hypothetical protein
VAGYEL